MFAIRTIEIVQILTGGGGPGRSTELLVNFIFNNAFLNYKYGYAAAASVILLFLCIFFIAVYWKLFRVKL